LGTLLPRLVMTSSAFSENVAGAKPGGQERHFCVTVSQLVGIGVQ
jgi:hypothetical protein